MNAFSSNDRRVVIHFAQRRAASLAGLCGLLLSSAADDFEVSSLRRIHDEALEGARFLKYLTAEVEVEDTQEVLF